MRTDAAREDEAKATLKREIEKDASLGKEIGGAFEAAVLARAYADDDEGDDHWLLLLLEAVDAAQAAESTTPQAAYASYDELETLQVIWRKLDKVIKARGGEDIATVHLKGARAALRKADIALRVAPSQSLHREYLVRTVTLLWCRYTGDKATVSNDAQSAGRLTQTPLVRFLRHILSSKLPDLTHSEIRRGVSLAK